MPADDESGDMGRWDWLDAEILLNQSLKGAARALTLLHEVLHAISDMYGLDLEESQVRVLEQALGSFVKDNPKEAMRIVNEILGDTDGHQALNGSTEQRPDREARA